MKTWRVIDTGYLGCHFNMAIDEALLEAYDSAEERMPVLRIYGWDPQAFSIGYFQNPDDELDLDRCRIEGIDFVRRITGGGVIFHKSELTYSIVCREQDLSARTFYKETYRFLCSFIVEAYKSLGLEAEYALQETARQSKSWFCFANRERYDILINGKKIGGNAQRRKKGMIFQHGSIPLKSDLNKALLLLRDSSAIDKANITSLSDALGQDISYNRLRDLLIKSFKQTFNVDIAREGLSKREEALSEHLLEEKYKREEWNLYRNASSPKARVA